jgi:hypothetical protein
VADPHPLTEEECRSLLRGAPWTRFAVLGGSVADGTTNEIVGRRRGWPDRVAQALRAIRPDLAYLNLCRRRLLTAQVRAAQLETALAFGPDLAAVATSGNDLRHAAFDIDTVETELARIVAALRGTGCTVVTVGLADVGRNRTWWREPPAVLAARARAVSIRLGAVYVAPPAPSGAGQPDRRNGCPQHGYPCPTATRIVRELGQRLGNAGRP